LREVTLGDRLVQRRPGLLLLRVDDIEPVPRRGERRPRFLDGGACLLVVRIGLLKTLERGVLVGGEPAVAHDIEPGSRALGVCRCDLGLSLRSSMLAGGGSRRDWPEWPLAQQPPHSPWPKRRGSPGRPA